MKSVHSFTVVVYTKLHRNFILEIAHLAFPNITSLRGNCIFGLFGEALLLLPFSPQIVPKTSNFKIFQAGEKDTRFKMKQYIFQERFKTSTSSALSFFMVRLKNKLYK